MAKYYFCFLLLLLAAGCEDAAIADTKMSAWGESIHLGQAEQRSAPHLWATSERVTAVWVGADTNGIYHHSRILTDGGLSPTATLPLSPVHPFAQQLLPASGDNLHLLWLDANAQGETRLYSAVISPKLELVRGPIMVSDRRTLRYAAAPAAGGASWVVFSGGLLAEPGLFALYLDAEGRARQDVIRLTTDADWPSLAQTNDGKTFLFWRRPSDGAVQRAGFTDGMLDEAQTIARASLPPGDRLESLDAALDSSHEYIFWNVTRADGQPETWWASGTPDSSEWPASRLGVTTDKDLSFETGFNSGTANAAGAGDQWLSWTAPLAGQFDTLPAAAQSGNMLALVYFREGQIAGYQEVVNDARLIGQPDLKTDRDRFLYLSWAQPNANGTADLWLASLKTMRRAD